MPIDTINALVQRIRTTYQECKKKSLVNNKKLNSEVFKKICTTEFANWGESLGYKSFRIFFSDVSTIRHRLELREKASNANTKNVLLPTGKQLDLFVS